MNQRLLFTAFFCYLPIIIFCQSYTFLLQPQPKDSFFYALNESTETWIGNGSESEKSIENLMTTYRYLSQSQLPNGDLSFQISLQQIEVTQKNLVDSVEQKNAFPTPSTFQSLKNQRFNLILDKRGKILQFEPHAHLLKGADLSDSLSQVALEQLLNEQLQHALVREHLTILTNYLPPQAVSLNDTWVSTDSLNAPFQTVQQTTFTLNEVKNDIAFIEFETTFSPHPNASGIDAGAVHLQFNVSGKRTGFLLVDITNGWVRKVDAQQFLQGTMTVFYISPVGTVLYLNSSKIQTFDLNFK